MSRESVEVMAAISKAEEGLAELVDIYSGRSPEKTVHRLIRALQLVENLKEEEKSNG